MSAASARVRREQIRGGGTVSNTREHGRAVLLGVLFIAVAVAEIAFSWWWYRQPRPGHVKDEALQVGRDASTFTAADEDYFHAMDGGIPLEKAEIQGRNTWIVWTAGNDRLWDQLVYRSAGALDFLKILSSNQNLRSEERRVGKECRSRWS